MTWTTLTLRVATPLFNGGADAGTAGPGDDSGVRVASIRGAMRFWFRALAGALTGPDLRLLGALERRVFGGLGADGAGASASALLLRIPRQPAVVRTAGPHRFLPSPTLPLNERRQDDSRWILYLMGQGLADLARCEILRPYVDAGQEFELKVGFRHTREVPAEERAAIEGLALASLWLACTYGGIGARTRRGFGGVRIVGASGAEALPPPWAEDGALLTPGLDYYGRLRMIWPDGPVASCMRYLSVLARDARLNPRAWDGVPSFPVLSRTYAPAGISGGGYFPNWEDALMTAGEQLRYFRAAQPNTSPGAHYRPRIETPEWVAAVHGAESRFPVGALGLPVGMKDNYVANADGAAAAGEQPRRRASPLWIRPVGAGREWRLFSFAFQAEFLPTGVHLWRGGVRGKALQVTDDDVKRQTDQWISVLRADESFKPYRHDDGTFEPDARRLTGDLRR